MHGTGSVTEFDAQRGLGLIEGDDGARLSFHCTQIVDESRSVPVGTAVGYEVVPGQLGVWEARSIQAVGR
jgi:cold shock CspA family protein